MTIPSETRRYIVDEANDDTIIPPAYKVAPNTPPYLGPFRCTMIPINSPGKEINLSEYLNIDPHLN